MLAKGLQLGHYRILQPIGSGGMGEVYLAEDTRLSRQVAIKVVRSEPVSYPDTETAKETARLFQREMRAISMLDHPNILHLIDFSEETLDNAPVTYMIMPYRPEGSLANWLQTHREQLTFDDVTSLIAQAADALQHAHNHQLIHQDVKPSNFLLRNRDANPNRPDLLLTDFGVAKLSTATATASQSIRGTPYFMAPEQWEGQPMTATDQYALAIMAYQLLTGRTPFVGRMEQVMRQHFMTPPPPPSTYNATIPPALDDVVLRALAKEPVNRFPSISAFGRAFQQAIQQTRLGNITVGSQQGTLTIPAPDTSTNEKTSLAAGNSAPHLSPESSALPALPAPPASPTPPIPYATPLVPQPDKEEAIPTLISAHPDYQTPVPNVPDTPSIPFNNVPTVRTSSPDQANNASSVHASDPYYPQMPSMSQPSNPNYPYIAPPPPPPAYEPWQPYSPPPGAITHGSTTTSKRSFHTRILVLVGLAFLVILASIIGFVAYQSHISSVNPTATSGSGNTLALEQSATAQAASTATAHSNGTTIAQSGANATATAITAQGNATATAVTVQRNATATAGANQPTVAPTTTNDNANQNPYPPYTGTLVIDDTMSSNSRNQWDTGQGNNYGCGFTSGTYHSFTAQVGTFTPCFARASNNFTNFSYRADVAIIQGDCGGLIFRASIGSNLYYYFEICQDGTYSLRRFSGNPGASQYIVPRASNSNIKTGNQTNRLAVAANGTSFQLFANKIPLTTVTDESFSTGQIGLLAEDYTSPTEVAFSNVRLWEV